MCEVYNEVMTPTQLSFTVNREEAKHALIELVDPFNVSLTLALCDRIECGFGDQVQERGGKYDRVPIKESTLLQCAYGIYFVLCLASPLTREKCVEVLTNKPQVVASVARYFTSIPSAQLAWLGEVLRAVKQRGFAKWDEIDAVIDAEVAKRVTGNFGGKRTTVVAMELQNFAWTCRVYGLGWLLGLRIGFFLVSNSFSLCREKARSGWEGNWGNQVD